MTPEKYSAEFKAKVALEAIKGLKTLNEIASETGVHPNQITHWKKQALAELPGVFSNRRSQDQKAQEELTAELYQHIGQLKVELDWLKKIWTYPWQLNAPWWTQIISISALPANASCWD